MWTGGRSNMYPTDDVAADSVVLCGVDREMYDTQFVLSDGPWLDGTRRFVTFLWTLIGAYPAINLIVMPIQERGVSAPLFEFVESGWPVHNTPKTVQGIVAILRSPGTSGWMRRPIVPKVQAPDQPRNCALIICREEELPDYERDLTGYVQELVSIYMRQDPRY